MKVFSVLLVYMSLRCVVDLIDYHLSIYVCRAALYPLQSLLYAVPIATRLL